MSVEVAVAEAQAQHVLSITNPHLCTCGFTSSGPAGVMNHIVWAAVTAAEPALKAAAWDEGYEASDHEAYHHSTHGRTDNPYRIEKP